jgi:hypothetical protein
VGSEEGEECGAISGRGGSSRRRQRAWEAVGQAGRAGAPISEGEAVGQAGQEGKGGRWAAAGPKSLIGLKSKEVKEN